MNQTVINSVYPKLVPMIAKANAPIDGVIDVFHGMGGEDNWVSLSCPWLPWRRCCLCDGGSLCRWGLALLGRMEKEGCQEGAGCDLPNSANNNLAMAGKRLPAEVHEAELSDGQDRLRAVV